MLVFSRRTFGYKGGVFLLFFAAVVFLIGFASPYWTVVEDITSSYRVCNYTGLFMQCLSARYLFGPGTLCQSLGIADLAGWFHAVRTFACVCLVGLIVACIYCIAINCCRTSPGPRSRFLEAIAAIAGSLGFFGCMLFVRYNPTNSLEALVMDDWWTFTWAFYMASIGSALSVVAAIIIAIYNKPVEQLPRSSGRMKTTIAHSAAYPAAQPAAYLVAYPAAYPAA